MASSGTTTRPERALFYTPASVEIEALSLHTPDLDDVFLALTGQPGTEMETRA